MVRRRTCGQWVLVFAASAAGLFSSVGCWAQTSASQIPQPPAAMLIPLGSAVYYAYFNWLLAALVFVFLAREALRTRSAFPLAFTIAAAIGGLVEPIYDGNMHVLFPHIDSPAFEFYNIAYPWYEMIGESIMAGPIYWMYLRFKRGIATRGLWGYFLIWWLYQILMEVPGNLTNSYIYYGPHPFRIFGFPVWLGLCLAFGIPLAGYVAHKLSEVLTGARLCLMVVVMIPVALFGSQLIGWPMWVTLNGGRGLETNQLAALVSLAFALSGYYCLTLIYCKERAQVAGARDLAVEFAENVIQKHQARSAS